MLASRIITALILAPLAIAAIYLLPLEGYALVFLGVAWLGAYEWAGLCGLAAPLQRAGYLLVLGALILLAWLRPELRSLALWLAVLTWLGGFVAVLRFPASARWLGRQRVTAAAGLLVMGGAWTALVRLREADAHWVLWLFLLAWSADVGAYFAGRSFGKRRLAPAVSPGKTWAGFWGGLGAALLLCTALQMSLLGAWTWPWAVVVVLLVVVAVLGDLVESMLKRVSGAKDSGSLLPGHGGVLDRIDSIIAALPFFALLVAAL